MKHRLLASIVAASMTCAMVVGAPPERASAACGSIPYTFTNSVSIVDAGTTNANNTFLIACATNVDNTQIGSAGIFPSQVISTGISTGTFGGAYPYTFTNSAGTQVPLTVQAAATQTVDLFDVVNNGRSTKYFYVSSSGVPTSTQGFLATAGSIVAGAGAVSAGTVTTGIQAGDLSAARTTAPTTTAAVFLGSDGTVYLDRGLTTGGDVTLNGAPLQITNTLKFGASGYASLSTNASQTELLPASSTQPFVFANAAGSVANLTINDGGGAQLTTSATTTQGSIPPAYTPAGAALGTTTHIVYGTFNVAETNVCAANSLCVDTISLGLSGAAAFSTGFVCSGSVNDTASSTHRGIVFSDPTLSRPTTLDMANISAIPWGGVGHNYSGSYMCVGS